MNLYPNTRGNAARDNDKNVRISTHLHAMQILFDAINPSYGIEHGMGRSSTSWLHQKNLDVLLSYEDNERWRLCDPCKNVHIILPFEGIDKFVESVKQTIPDIQKTICLVDGPGTQRVDILIALIRLEAPGIAFHDAETLMPEEVSRIKEVVEESGYFIRQHVGKNPETLICSKNQLDLSTMDFVEF